MEVIMSGKTITVEKIVNALSCGNPGCSCGRKSGSGWVTHCPAHDDEHPSLSISEGEDGKLLVKCFAGCSQDAVIEALKVKGLWPVRANGNGFEQSNYASFTTVGLTLGALAKAKHLPLDYLKSMGLSDRKRNGVSSVSIPYVNEEGQEVAVRYRLAIDGNQKFAWRRGDKVPIYGLWRLQEIRDAGWVLLVEGESDCWTAWHCGLPALGIPGKTTWKKEWGELVKDLQVYLWVEPDAPELPVKMGSDVPGLMVIHAPEGIKDLSEAHLQEKDIPAMMEDLKAKAVSVESLAQRQSAAEMAELRSQAAPMLKSPDILQEVINTLRLMGLAGQEREAKILYLALTSRLLDRPVNVVVKGLSSGGKSHLVNVVSRLFPKSAYHDLSAMSERALIYDEEPIKHRFLIIYEAVGIGSETGQYIMRSLLSEGRVKYTTVEKTDRGLGSRYIEREGPTGLITTTTMVSLHPENETRMLSLEVNDAPEQTREILIAQASGRSAELPNITPFLALQSLIEAECPKVAIPFSTALAQECAPVVVRIRRDFPMVLTLIESHAILNAHHRSRDSEGRVIASIADYEAIYSLVSELLSYGEGQSVSADVRATVWAVRDLTGGDRNHNGVTGTSVAQELRLHKATVSRRILKALRSGFLINHETRKGFPHKLVLGDPMPEDNDAGVLPRPDEIEQKYSAFSAETDATVQPKGDSLENSGSSRLHLQSNPSATSPPQGTGSTPWLRTGCGLYETANGPISREDDGAVAGLQEFAEDAGFNFSPPRMPGPEDEIQHETDCRSFKI
jgi:hypothetical protein